MTSWVCVDAGIVLKLVANEADSHTAELLWRSWLQNGVRPIVPPLFSYEVTAVIRKWVHRQIINETLGRAALKTAFAFGVKLQTFPEIHHRAWELATKFNRPTTYNTHYLALAEKFQCDFWTADKRLFNAVSHHLPWVHLLGNLTNV